MQGLEGEKPTCSEGTSAKYNKSKSRLLGSGPLSVTERLLSNSNLIFSFTADFETSKFWKHVFTLAL